MESKLIGKTIDNYRILALLGKGGMGVVYKALDVQLEKIVALKMMDLGFARDDSFLKRFRSEARALGRLQNPNIVIVHALRETELGLLLVMEFIDGDTLAQLIRAGGPVPYDSALPIFRQILHALEHAHGAGVIHRDLKPSNIMINQHGTVKVMDFGLAKIQHPSESTTSTMTGGTLHYMSPEQIQGLSHVDRRSDLYSLGMSLYETLTGQTPFNAHDTDYEIRKTIVEGKLPSPERLNPAIPKDLSKIVMKALAQNPNARFQIAEEMAEALMVFEKNAPAKSLPPAPPALPKLKVAAVSAAAMLAAIAIFILWESTRSPSLRTESPTATLSIATQPAGATVFLNGDSAGITPLEWAHSQEGTIALRLQKADHFTIDTSMVTTKGRAAAWAFSLRPAATLALTVAPPEASVMIDGKVVEPAHLAGLQLPVGRHDIQITAPGYQTRREQLGLNQGVNPQRNYVLEKIPLTTETPVSPVLGTLNVKSDPAGATILVDGEELGTTPKTAQIKTGAHDIVLRRAGYGDYTTSITVSSGQVSEVFGKLQTQAGTLSVLVKPYGTIYLDGVLEQQDTNVRYTKALAAGTHRLRAVHPALGNWEKNVTIAPDQEAFFEIDFNKQVTLNVAAFDESNQPVFASIYVDNADLKQDTPRQLTLPIGLHTISVKREGYRMLGQPQTILLENNMRDPLRFTLQKIQ